MDSFDSDSTIEDATSFSTGQHNIWESTLDSLLFDIVSSEDNKLTVVQRLQLLFQELLSVLPSAPRARNRAQSQHVEFDLEQVIAAADALKDMDGWEGKADAGFMLAVLSATGLAAPHMPLNDTWAIQALHVAARAGSQESQLALAHRYYFGDGVPKSCQEGVRRVRTVADELVSVADESSAPEVPLEPVSLRMRHRHGSYDDSSSQETWHQLQLQAEMFNLGDAYQRLMGYRQLLGEDMEANPVQAMQHFEAAAAQGDGYAVFNVGYMHMKGIGTPRNATAAEQHFKVAAGQGVAPAYNGLGVLYFSGESDKGVDYAAARRAFQKGAALDDPDSMFNLGTIYAGAHGVEQNHTLAFDYYLDAHDAGHWRAPYALGVAHQSGEGVPANCTFAWKYLEIFIKERSSWTDQMELAMLAVNSGETWELMMRYAVAAVQGSAIAQLNLAWLLQREQAAAPLGHDRLRLCQRLLLQAAKGGLPEAWVEAGNLAFQNGSFAEAINLYNLSAGAGDAEGMYSLGWMHAAAKGTSRNVSLAIQLYKEAVRRAPDWQHAAPSFLAIVLLPCFLILQWSQELLGKQLQQGGVRFVKRALLTSWDLWVLTVAAVALTAVMWRRHQRFGHVHHVRHRQEARNAGVG